MNTTTIALVITALIVLSVASVLWFPRPRTTRRESFTVLYPSKEKLQKSWSRAGILTGVLPDGRLR